MTQRFLQDGIVYETELLEEFDKVETEIARTETEIVRITKNLESASQDLESAWQARVDANSRFLASRVLALEQELTALMQGKSALFQERLALWLKESALHQESLTCGVLKVRITLSYRHHSQFRDLNSHILLQHALTFDANRRFCRNQHIPPNYLTLEQPLSELIIMPVSTLNYRIHMHLGRQRCIDPLYIRLFGLDFGRGSVAEMQLV